MQIDVGEVTVVIVVSMKVGLPQPQGGFRMSGILVAGDWIDFTATPSHHPGPQHCALVVKVAQTVKCHLPATWMGVGLPQGTLRIPEIYLFSFSVGRVEKLRRLCRAAGWVVSVFPSLGVLALSDCSGKTLGSSSKLPVMGWGAQQQKRLDLLLTQQLLPQKVFYGKEAKRMHDPALLKPPPQTAARPVCLAFRWLPS